MVNWLTHSEAPSVSHNTLFSEPKLSLVKIFGRISVILEEEWSERSHLEIDELERIVDLLIQEGSQGKNIRKVVKKCKQDIQTRIEMASVILVNALKQLKEEGHHIESLVARIEAVKNKLYQTMDEKIIFNMDGELPFLNPNARSSDIERTLFGKDEPWLEVVYSDELKIKNPERYKIASEVADWFFHNKIKTFRWAQILLERYYERSLELRIVRIFPDSRNTNRYLHYYGWKFIDENPSASIKLNKNEIMNINQDSIQKQSPAYNEGETILNLWKSTCFNP